MTVVETIPVPREKARRGEQFRVRTHDLYAWPDQELVATFQYNPHADRWVWELEHQRIGRLFPKGIATLQYNYSAWPWALFRFIDTGRHARAVTQDNLGRNVKLAVYPGPRGGSFHPDADIDEDEEERILRRRFWDPVR